MEPFSIGRTFSRTFTLIGATWGSVGVYLLILTAINVLAQQAVNMQITGSIAGEGSETAAFFVKFGSAYYWTYVVMAMAVAGLELSGSLNGLVKAAQGEKTTLSDCFRVGFARFVPVLVAYFLWIVGVTAGTMLFFVPGIILVCMWSVAMPVLATERIGIFEAFGRSRDLTRGSRGSIFLVLLVYVVIVYIALASVVGVIVGGSYLQFSMDLARSPWMALVTIPLGVVSSLVLNALLASLYVETLTIKGEGPTGHLEAVFG